MMKNPDDRIIGADPLWFSEFIDADGLVCFQVQTNFRFQENPSIPIIRVSREFWLGIHNDSLPEKTQAQTLDEKMVEHVTLQIDQRNHQAGRGLPGHQPMADNDPHRILIEAVEHQIWDLRLHEALLGSITNRRDRQIKTRSLFLKHTTEWLRSASHPNAQRIGRIFTPFTGC
jgi:hypothetical protein